MLTDVVKIGNSKGIRIPAVILKECQIADKVEMEVRDGKIIIFPVAKPRKNWSEQFKEMSKKGDDKLLTDDTLDANLEDWEWK
jgi:antitoxin MazE